MKKRLLSVLLCAAMLAVMLPSAFASDIEGHWAQAYIQYLDQEEVINPSKTNGTYEPDRQITRAEFMRYVNRAFHFEETASISYSDVKTNAWYYETIQIAEKYGYINGVGDNKMDPDGKMTREQAAVIIGRLYKVDPGDIAPADLPFSDRDKIAKWSAGYIKAAVDKGFLSGYSDGTFQPDRVVTRAEVCKVLYYYMGTALSTAGKAYTGADLKTDTDNVTISESCTLSDATVKGDLYITEGLGSASVTLSNVTVEGSLIVSGGTVIIKDTTSDYMIVSSPMGRLLQVTATGAARIGQTDIRCSAGLYGQSLSAPEQDGFPSVTVDGDGRVSLTLDGFVTDLQLAGESIVSTTADTLVYRMTVEQPASVTGYGTVYQADIRASDVSFASSVKVAGYTIADGIAATVGGQSVSGSQSAGVLPESIAVDLSQPDALGGGVSVCVPDGLTVTAISCNGRALAADAYRITPSGARIMQDYLASLSVGSHTVHVTTSDGKRTGISVTVTQPEGEGQTQGYTFDRYYASSGFRDVSVQLDGVTAGSEVTGVVLGMSELDYTFDDTAHAIVLRRGELAGLRAGTYTVSVDLQSGGGLSFDLQVRDSTPSGVQAQVAEYDTFAPVEASFALPLSAYTVRSVNAVQNGTVTQMQPDADFTTTAHSLTLTKAALEKFRQAGGLVTFEVTLSNDMVYTLVVDYIA